jgi:hypothetical protein
MLTRREFVIASSVAFEALQVFLPTSASATTTSAQGGASAPPQGWWMTEPVRWVQTNLRETDAALDPVRLIEQVAEMRANVLHIGMGGICAFYPTKVPFHYPSPYLPAGRDLFGDILKAAHARGIRVVGRFDLREAQKPIYDAHPDWFFRTVDGEPLIYAGLYSTCVNGGYYREQAPKVLDEATSQYEVDAVFFNAWGNKRRDFSGNDVGLCHCDNCTRRYAAMFGKPIPRVADDEYQRFMAVCLNEVGTSIAALIHRNRPKAAMFTYALDFTDGVTDEANLSLDRPLPLWPHSAGFTVNMIRNSVPDKAAINFCIQFADYAWRFATAPQPEIALRLWQNVANGGALVFTVIGTLDNQQDRQGLETAGPIFRWLADHEEFYARQESAARVLLLGGQALQIRAENDPSGRGLYRLLSEEHIPLAVSSNLNWLDKREFDVVIASDWAPRELQTYAESGGRVLIVSSKEPAFDMGRVVRTWEGVKGYMRVRNHARFPSLENTDLVLLNGNYTEVEGDGTDSITFVPPSIFGPPEKIHVDMQDTTKPGIVRKAIGKGEVVWMPWDLAAIYYRQSFPAHAALFRDVLDTLLPRRQIRTNAHPLVTMTPMRQGSRLIVHLINFTGHSQTAYFPPIPMQDIRIAVAGTFGRARALRASTNLHVRRADGYAEFTVPTLGEYEAVVLE